MNVYDFDETIYDGDSTVDFVRYSMVKRPKCLICFPKIAFTGLLYVLHILYQKDYLESLNLNYPYIQI